MNSTKAELERLIEEIEKKVKELRENREDSLCGFGIVIREIAAVMSGFLQERTVPLELSLRRLENLNESYSNRDVVWLADVLQYEITDLLYRNIMMIENQGAEYVSED